MSSADDHTRGTVNTVGGKIKEGLGKLTGDRSLEAEGHADQTKGNVQKAIGNLKDAFAPRTDR